MKSLIILLASLGFVSVGLTNNPPTGSPTDFDGPIDVQIEMEEFEICFYFSDSGNPGWYKAPGPMPMTMSVSTAERKILSSHGDVGIYSVRLVNQEQKVVQAFTANFDQAFKPTERLDDIHWQLDENNKITHMAINLDDLGKDDDHSLRKCLGSEPALTF